MAFHLYRNGISFWRNGISSSITPYFSSQKRNLVPEIGNEVWIGPNAVIVGNIKIGNNVLIAPNSYLNTDVPSNSIVIGNPAEIIPKNTATEGYINHKIDY
jgi:serine O-acetyltransferase